MTGISPDLVRKELKRILDSPQFAGSKKTGRFLRYVVEQALNGHGDKITQYAIAVEALDYGKAFDPTTVPNVRVLARRLRRTLDRYYTESGRQNPIQIEIPKGSYAPVYRYNLPAPQAPVTTECSTPGPQNTEAEVKKPAIAVVMFENLNGKDKNGFIARGLTTEILVSLSRFPELSILGPLDQPPNKRMDFESIGRNYGANFILRGWVRSQGAKIRINTTLTKASDGHKLWAHTFDFDLKNTSLFELEDQVSSQVAGVVADGVGIVFRQIKTDSYHKYLRLSKYSEAVLLYNNMWLTLAPQDFAKALKAINNILAKQPEDALMLAFKSNIFYGDVIFEMDLAPEARSEMEALAIKACSLDPDLQIARYNRVVQHGFHGRADPCIEEVQKVVAMNPKHARILAGCAIQTASVEAYDIGWDLVEQAKKLNPHYPSWYHFANYLVHLGNERYEAAWAEAQNIHIEGLFWHPLLRAAILGKLGRVKEAQVFIDGLLQIKPEFPKRPKEFLRLIFVTDRHVEMVWDGLSKAGLKELK